MRLIGYSPPRFNPPSFTESHQPWTPCHDSGISVSAGTLQYNGAGVKKDYNSQSMCSLINHVKVASVKFIFYIGNDCCKRNNSGGHACLPMSSGIANVCLETIEWSIIRSLCGVSICTTRIQKKLGHQNQSDQSKTQDRILQVNEPEKRIV